MSLAKLAAKLLLVLCTAAKAVLEALNCFRSTPQQMRSFRLGIGSDWQCYIAFGPQLGSLPLLQMALLLLGPLLLLRRLILI